MFIKIKVVRIGGIQIGVRIGFQEVIGAGLDSGCGVSGQGCRRGVLRICARRLILDIDIECFSADFLARHTVEFFERDIRVGFIVYRSGNGLGTTGLLRSGYDVGEVDFRSRRVILIFDAVEGIIARNRRLFDGVFLPGIEDHSPAVLIDSAVVPAVGTVQQVAAGILRNGPILILDGEEAVGNKGAGIGVLLVDGDRNGLLVVVKCGSVGSTAGCDVYNDILLAVDRLDR